MLSRWIQENQKFLGILGGALLLLLIFQWLFVWGNRDEFAANLTTYNSTHGKLRKLYKPAKDSDRDVPSNRRLKQREGLRDEAQAALAASLKQYGAARTSPFVLPAGEEAAPENYYFGVQSQVVDEITQAAADAAVNLADERLGLPPNLPRGAEPKATVDAYLWNLQIVRTVLLAAIGAGVDTIERVQASRSEPRSVQEGDTELYGTLQEFEVQGDAAAVARWLEMIQTDGGYVAMVACRIKREQAQPGVVSCRAALMGVASKKHKPGESQDDD